MRLHHWFLIVLALSILFAALAAGMVLYGLIIIGTFVGLFSLGVLKFFRLSRHGRLRARVFITIVSTLIGISPFFLGGGVVLPGTTAPLLKLNFPLVEWFLIPFALVGGIVLSIVDQILFLFIGPVPIIHFGGAAPGNVRPDAACLIWLSIAAAFGSSLLIEECRKRWHRRRRRGQQGQQPEAMA